MRKRVAYALVMLMTAIVLPYSVSASETTVNNQDELLAALQDTAVTEIILGADIETTQKINIERDVTIDGQNHTITYVGKFRDKATGVESDDNTVWHTPAEGETPVGAIYVIQVYMADVTIKDIALTNGNRALGINGGTLTLEGVIDVTGNGFDAIELGHGSGVPEENVSTLVVSDATILVNGSENDTTKTLYVDDSVGKLVRVNEGTETVEDLAVGTKLSYDEIGVNVMYSYSSSEANVAVEVFQNIKANNQNLILTNDDETAIWVFEGSKLTDTSIALNTNITFTEKAPTELKSDIDKVVGELKNVRYLNFSHEGKLPGLAEIAYRVSEAYEVGTELYVAHFNEDTKQLDEVTEVTVDENGYITWEITHCSTYVLYTGAEVTNAGTITNTGTTVENAKTGDINLLLIMSLILAAGVSLKVVYKKILVKVNH